MLVFIRFIYELLSSIIINTLRFYLSVRLSVCDGCGRGHNEFAGRVQNYHVRSSCHRNGYNLSRDSKKLLLVRTLSIAGYAKDAIVDAYHRTSDGQEHKIIWRAGPEQDTIFYLRVTACREQGSHCHDERLAWVALRGQTTLYSNSFVESLGSELDYNRANNFHPG